MSNLGGRLVYGYGVSVGMISDQWRNFSDHIVKEGKIISELCSNGSVSDSEKVCKIADFSWRVQRSADFMASLCQLLLPKELSRNVTREGGDI